MTEERKKQAIDDLYKFNVFTEKEKDALYDFLHTGEFCFLTFNGLYWKETKNCVIIKVKNLKVTLTETRLRVERFQDGLSEGKGCHNCKHDKEKIESIKEKYKNGVTIEHINTMLGIVK